MGAAARRTNDARAETTYFDEPNSATIENMRVTSSASALALTCFGAYVGGVRVARLGRTENARAEAHKSRSLRF